MLTKTLQFRGKPYQIVCKNDWPPGHPVAGAPHPSWYSFEDESTVRDAKWLIEPGDCVFDIGSAFGSYILPAFAVGAAYGIAWSPQGIEGDPDSEAEYLRQSLTLNGWSDRCEIHEFGLYDEDGWVNTQSQAFTTTDPSSISKASKLHAEGDVIQVVTLDSWFKDRLQDFKKKYPRVWFKIDVEGAEVEVLKGAKHCIDTLRPSILLENHNFKRASLEQEVRELLTSYGYREIETTPYHAVSHSLYRPRPFFLKPGLQEVYANQLYLGHTCHRWSPHPQILIGGSVLSPEDWQHLTKDFGVGACISVESEHADAGKGIEKLLEVPAPDDGTPRPPDSFAQIRKFATEVLSQDPKVVFYVHCQMGGSRSPAYAYFLMCSVFGLSREEALRALHDAGKPEYGNHNYHKVYLHGADQALSAT